MTCAIKDFSETIRLDPKFARAFDSRGTTYYSKRDYHSAIVDFSETIRLSPTAISANNNLAWLLAACPREKLRDGKRAVELATKACELTEWKNAEMLATLAAAYAERGDFDEAVKWQKKAIELGNASKEFVAKERQRLKLFEDGKPYRDE